MARSSQFRKYENHGQFGGGLGEQDTGKGPTKGPGLGFVPTHSLTVGDGGANFGYVAQGVTGALSPLTFDGDTVDDLFGTTTGNLFVVEKSPATQFSGRDSLFVNIEGYNGGAQFTVDWDGVVRYDVLDAALVTYLQGQVGNTLQVRLELGPAV